MSFSEHRLIPTPPRKQGEQSTTFRPPPVDGSFTVQQMCAWYLQHSPNHRIFVYAHEDGSLRNICWTEAVTAAYTCARLMKSGIPFKEKASIVAILSMSDTITYTSTTMGLQRANYIVFPISPRNSAPDVARLLHEVGVQHVLVGRDSSVQDLSHEALDILKSQYPSADLPELSSIPVFEDIFLPDWRAHTNYDDPHLVSVDSCTAGLLNRIPKPIDLNCHRLIEHTLVPWFGGRDLCDVVFAVHGLSMYHGMGVLAFLYAISSGLVLGVFEPKVPATSSTLDMFVSAKAMNSDIVFCAPYVLEAWSHKSECIEWLSTRSGMLYGGGPLNKEVGDHLASRGVSMFVLYGSTECGIVTPVLPVKASDCWNYFEFSKFTTPKMVASGPDLFEFIAVKNMFSEPSVINTNVDGADGFATSDLLTPHPTKPGYWKVIGRKDDQIVHNTGKKTNPGPLGMFPQSMLNQDPHVLAAVMFGHGKPQVGVLIEPGPQFSFDPVDKSKLVEFRNLIWPTVKKINQIAPQHSRLFKEMIIVTKPGRPVAYTAKNTVRRQVTLDNYSEDIETLYETVEGSTQSGILPPLEWDYTSTYEFVRNVVLQTFPHPIPDNADLFQHGCDSIQAIWIRNILFRALRDSADSDTRQISENFVYSNPSITQLAKFLVSVAQGTLISAGADVPSRVDAMHQMVQKYSKNFPAILAGNRSGTLTLGVDKVVLVTGTTGGLGCHILANLVLDGTVKHIYAVNRPGAVPVARRQQQTFTDHGLEVDMEKVTMLEADLSVETQVLDQASARHLGMFETFIALMQIKNSVTHIIHNGTEGIDYFLYTLWLVSIPAWRVDFNLGLSSFEPNIRGLRKLIDIALTSQARLVYTSSIGVFLNATEDHPLAEVHVDATVAQGMGYGESKWVSEELLRLTPSLRYSIIRVGQLTGGPKGTWKMKEWIPSMIQSSTVLGFLPDDNKCVSWLPVHIAAQLLVNHINNSNSIMHLVHPKPVLWSPLARFASQELNVKLVSFTHWLEALENSALDATVLPAMRLLPHYKHTAKIIGRSLRNREAFGLPRLSTTLTQDTSIPSLDENEVRNWMQYWCDVKMLN
ncbi:hypothetical protein EDD18DRAFT_1460649 [Armillaria luteobubalina]|uniref:Acetyl-CoA synthetase-like protein n=1 Tax=Armillaria luteobubalina TaxID=153913 RepID=A0AA39QBE8_9AGAR|nr:hypothetical protein EDD18DRAFT_1460649 [Armillaria luteobubalina]